MKELVSLFKQHTFKIITGLIVSFLLGSFSALLSVPADFKDMQLAIDGLDRRVNENEKDKILIYSRLNYHDKDISRLTNENIKDSLAQRYIIQTLQDIKQVVIENRKDFKNFEQGYYNRVR